MKTEKNSINVVGYWIGMGNRPCTVHEEDSHRGEKPTILVVDDDPRMLQSVKELLNVHGYSCTTVDGGKAALKLLARREIDLMLLDLHMPDVDGHELLRFIRNESNQSSVPVLMVTTEGDAGKLAAIQQDGVSAILDKPFEVKAVKRLIEASLAFP